MLESASVARSEVTNSSFPISTGMPAESGKKKITVCPAGTMHWAGRVERVRHDLAVRPAMSRANTGASGPSSRIEGAHATSKDHQRTQASHDAR
ncbi:MAG: hypothetical protein JWN79_91 [Gemmatimonadetes bacterium]|jgi:hypothetical protein|nr:hypothetical protein [Gemmatimonadota bacterium]